MGQFMRKHHTNTANMGARKNATLIEGLIQSCQKFENQGFARVPDSVIQNNLKTETTSSFYFINFYNKFHY